MWRWLLTGQRHGPWYWLFRKDPPEIIWAEHAEIVLAHFVKRHPGTRPWLWWKIVAREPRRRLGGTGDSLDSCTNLRETPYDYGVPWHWRREDDPFKHGTPLSADDPPRYESEASYLLRLDLLEPGELKRIPRIEFQPEVIRVVDDGDIELGRVGLH
jgi:hypothetical protein